MYEHIKNYLAKNIYPFHMPGHKRNLAFLPPDLHELDLTEIPGMDVLSMPTGILLDFQKSIADFFGADESFFLVNGSSAGIVASICALCKPGRPLYVARNAHASTYNAMALAGGRPVYILPEITQEGIAGGIDPAKFDHMPQGGCAIIVSPTYEGYVSDIKSIANRIHARGGMLIVDEAHGAHFAFHKSFPSSALAFGADIVINSLHKTLPMLGQCAALHASGQRVDKERLRFYVNALQTTSPSYMLMAAADYTFKLLRRDVGLFDDYVKRLEALRHSMPVQSGAIRLVEGEIGKHGIHDADMGKILLSLHTDLAADKAEERLARDFGLQVEMAAGRHLLAMTSVADTDEGFLRLSKAISALNRELPVSNNPTVPPDTINYATPQIACAPHEALSAKSELVPWEKASGRVAAQIVTKYPPGIALVAPGEIIPAGLKGLGKHVRVLA